jgi:peptidoglycan hydrolase-like amidase
MGISKYNATLQRCLAFRRWSAGAPGRLYHAGMGLCKKAVMLEAGAAIIFFGSLATHQELAQNGTLAIHELNSLGYRTPTGSEPVRVYPSKTGASFSSAHAGGWHPGVISLREDPAGSSGPGIYLRHELMHEASYRTCAGKLPLWAEEAAAIAFSGELKGQAISGSPTGIELDHLREQARIGATLDTTSYSTLSRLVSTSGWPSQPCAISNEMEKLLSARTVGPGFSYILISLLSGELLDAGGDLKARHPPGSLLKIPYAASLKEAAYEAVGTELSASDTTRLLNRKGSFSLDKFCFLTSLVKDAPLVRNVGPQGDTGKDERFWRQYLGERDRAGKFPFEANLRELALVLRASLLSEPARFSGLSGNGFIPGSTLYNEPEHDKTILKSLHAICKTGTASDERGNPLAGHLMVAWPQEEPLFLAVFRGLGSNGASSLHRASETLREWSSRYTPAYGQVRVRLLSLTPRSSWEIQDECPSLEKEEAGGRKVRFSTCGRFKIISSARGSRSERLVSGLLESFPDGSTILRTDPETYADAVLSSEAQDLHGEAQKALRAAIVWNGVHGGHRHPETMSLCDSTHCMVFQGQVSERAAKPRIKTDLPLLGRLDETAAQKKLDWLPFSEGGIERWEKKMPSWELKQLVNEPAVLDLRRERTRYGEIAVHLMYPESEESVPCEVFRARLKLPSCPESIQYDTAISTWTFQGIGKGHGQGLSVEKARALAKSGYSASAILKDAYR